MSANMKQTDRVKELRQPVEQIWLAGLGALALTEEEGGKLFKSLVKRGKGFEKITYNRLEDAFEATKAVPGNAMTRIEEVATDTFSGVLRRLGVPSRREINSLTRRVEGLATTLEKRTAKPRRAATKAKRNGMKRRAAATSRA